MYWKRSFQNLKLVIRDQPGQIGRIGVVLGSFDIRITNVSLQHIPSSDKVNAEMVVRIPGDVDMTQILERLEQIDGVYLVERMTL